MKQLRNLNLKHVTKLDKFKQHHKDKQQYETIQKNKVIIHIIAMLCLYSEHLAHESSFSDSSKTQKN